MALTDQLKSGFAATALASLAMVFAAGPVVAEDLRTLCAESARDGDVIVCERAVKQFPNDAEARWNYARAIYVSGQYEDAIEHYRAAVALAPDNAQAHLELAGTFASLKMYGDAVAPIQEATRLAPDNPMVHRVAAIVYREVGQLQLAVDANERAAELGDQLAIYELSQIYSLGIGVEADPAKAIKWLARAAQGGHVAAMRQLARVFRNGELGQTADPEKAAHWERKVKKAREQWN